MDLKKFKKEDARSFETCKDIYGFEINKHIIESKDYAKYNTDIWLQLFMEINEEITDNLGEIFQPPSSFRLTDVTQSFHMMDSSFLITAEGLRQEML
jgi:hypothetical protein